MKMAFFAILTLNMMSRDVVEVGCWHSIMVRTSARIPGFIEIEKKC